MTTETRPDKPDSHIRERDEIPSWIFDDPRWIRDPETGNPCVRATPGIPKITSQDVKEWLKDFP